MVNRIKAIRAMRAAGKTKGADLQKRCLPLLCFCAASFDVAPAPSDSKDGRRRKGQTGRWRLQQSARLSGLFMVDYDHVGDPQQRVRRWLDAYREEHDEAASMDEATLRRAFFGSLGVVLCHVTSSGEGLRLVGVAREERGNLAQNQAWLTSQLEGMTLDESCKDASRGSFCPGFEDIIYINKEKLFNYENPDYDEKFGPLYRGGNSRPAGLPGSGAAARGHATAATGGQPDGMAPGQGTAGSGDSDGLDERLKAGYHGKSYEEICDAWYEVVRKGKPSVGDRHQSLFDMALDLRYICDHDPQLLARVIGQCDVGQAVIAERGADEIARIASDACTRRQWRGLPGRVSRVLEAAGVHLAGDDDGEKPEAAPATDYDAYARRLLPLLSDSPGLREAVADMPDRLKLGGVLAATAMLGTYLTRTWWEHFDGRLYRLSFLTYIIGAAASGKSFLTHLDGLLMAPMKSADEVGRSAERQFKEQQKTRKANEKLPEQPHPVIRYCPSSTSNAILYRRLQDAIDPMLIDPTTDAPLHLHLITVESELATALRAQVGSWAGKNDLELKSFHNELAGVDYANTESTNGIMQVNWNQVVSGTMESLSRKIRPQNVLDGLVTRLSLFLMPQNDYQMLERRRYLRDHNRECYLRQLGILLEDIKGELKCPRLVDFCFQYEEELTRQASIEQDKCLDYFRKRIPVIMMRHTLVRMVLRQMDSLAKGHPLVEQDDDLEYARLIGDWTLEMQMTMFGQMVMDALEKEQEAFAPIKLRTKTRTAFNSLPSQFTRQELVDAGIAKNINTVYVTLSRWLNSKLIEQTGDNQYKKLFKTL